MQVIVLEESLLTNKDSNLEENSSSSKHIKPLSEDFYDSSNAMLLYTSGTTGPPKGLTWLCFIIIDILLFD